MEPLVDYDCLSTDAKRAVQGARGVEEALLDVQRRYQCALFELERKWAPEFQAAYARRYSLLEGKAVATAQEVACGQGRSLRMDPDYTGIAGRFVQNGRASAVNKFWAQVLLNSEVSASILDSDIPALEYLVNVAVSYPVGPTPGFTLEFLFSPNKFFKNSRIRVTYWYTGEVDDTGELEPSHVIADKIQWKQGQNLIKMAERPAAQQVEDGDGDDEDASFFALLQPAASISTPPPPRSPERVEEEEDAEEERKMDLQTAFDVGLELKALLPNAVDFFMGDLMAEDDDDDDWEGFSDGSGDDTEN
ncbi:hypothetical protein AURDEDRAFT_155295 [Auricularia subglabra TFB-10046 SS5]|nr:hypothetical protein AURDEDRAFT_155295 [Auricularia subglabra TFB-10046 SS5]